MHNAKIKCEIDGEEVHYLPTYLSERHGMDSQEYLKQFPGSPLESAALSDAYQESLKNICSRQPPPPENLTVDLYGISLPVNPDVPEEACLPEPEHYQLPKSGDLADDAARAVRYWAKGRSQWIWGPTGAGKDALPSHLCQVTRTPSSLFSINMDTDVLQWLYEKTFEGGETKWRFGELFNALVHGYTSPTSGRRIPMTIVLSDFDRAGVSQAEALRLIMDSIQGRVKGPRGETYSVLPGTRIIITANSMGAGDASGKNVSSNIIDTSILNRVERKVRFHHLHWEDEKNIIKAKFPLFAKHYEHVFPAIGEVTKALRAAVEAENLYGDFSHRDLCAWLGDVEDCLEHHREFGSGPPPGDLIQRCFHSYSDGLPDIENKNYAHTILDPKFKGGFLPRGDVQGVVDQDLDVR